MQEIKFDISEKDKVKVEYDKVKFLEILDNELEDEIRLINIPNKYVRLKEDLDLKHWRLVSIEQLVSKRLFQKFGPVYRDFLTKSKNIMFIFNYIGKKPVAVVMRSLDDKIFMDISINSNIVYGLNELPDNFRYGDTIMLVEGLFDKEVMGAYLKDMGYNNIHPIAVLTSSVTNKKAELLSKITDKFIINPDNDKAGENSIERTKTALLKQSYGAVRIKVVKNIPFCVDYGAVKDIGDCYPISSDVKKYLKEKIDGTMFERLVQKGDE